MSMASVFTPFTKRSLGKALSKSVSTTLEDPAKRREFEVWYEKTYGKKYVWKKGSRLNDTQPQTL